MYAVERKVVLFKIDIVFDVVSEAPVCCLGGERLSALSSSCLFGCVVFGRSFVLHCTRLDSHFSAVHSIFFCLCRGHPSPV